MTKIDEELENLKKREERLKAEIDESLGTIISKTKKSLTITGSIGGALILILWLLKPRKKRLLKQSNHQKRALSRTITAFLLPYLIDFVLKNLFKRLKEESNIHE